MENYIIEYYDLYNCKHHLRINADELALLYKEQYKIDASEIIGIPFILEADFILKPISNYIQGEQKIIRCQILDENGNSLELNKEYWLTKVKKMRDFWKTFVGNNAIVSFKTC